MITLKRFDSRAVKAYILYELDSMKVVKAPNVVFREREIQLFSAKETIDSELPNLVSPNMHFDDDWAKGEKIAERIQDRVRGNNLTLPAVQNLEEDEENP